MVGSSELTCPMNLLFQTEASQRQQLTLSRLSSQLKMSQTSFVLSERSDSGQHSKI